MKITVTLAGEGPLESVTVAMPPPGDATPTPPPDPPAEQDAGADPRLVSDIRDISLVIPGGEGEPRVIPVLPADWRH